MNTKKYQEGVKLNTMKTQMNLNKCRGGAENIKKNLKMKNKKKHGNKNCKWAWSLKKASTPTYTQSQYQFQLPSLLIFMVLVKDRMCNIHSKCKFIKCRFNKFQSTFSKNKTKSSSLDKLVMLWRVSGHLSFKLTFMITKTSWWSWSSPTNKLLALSKTFNKTCQSS